MQPNEPNDRIGGRRIVTHVSRVVGVVAPLGTVIVACGARSGLPIPDVGAAVEPDSDGGGCVASGVAVEQNVPNLYFVLDISGSMRPPDVSAGAKGDKWEPMRQAVAGLIQQIGPNARFGATVFPDPSLISENNCATGTEIMPLSVGDAQGTASNAFLNATASLNPNGGTPTASTLRALLPKFSSFPRGATFAILATDGGPNCDSGIDTCTIDQCTSNIDMVRLNRTITCAPGVQPNCCDPSIMGGGACLDGDATVQATNALRSAGVQTYVMGIPGSAPYAALLDQLARAGGTARRGEPLYYSVNSSDEAALSSAFEEIAAAAMRSCMLTLHDKVNDASKVNVYVNDVVVPNGPDGWSLMGQTITLRGMTCAGFGMGPADAGPSPVRVTQGCPTLR